MKTTKKCNSCFLVLGLDEFPSSVEAKDGRACKCNNCLEHDHITLLGRGKRIRKSVYANSSDIDSSWMCGEDHATVWL